VHESYLGGPSPRGQPGVGPAVYDEPQRSSVCWCRINAVSEHAGKYARFELERRFLVGCVPEGIAEDRGWRISDRYIKNTHLRLRRMEPIHGGEIIFKLGQKQVPSPPDFSRMTITNIYLSPGEYAVFAGLEALELHKLRHSIEHDDRMFSVDVFNDHLTGLVLAEVGFETRHEMDQPFDLPAWVIREVSGDIRFTGGALANLTADQAAGLIRQITAPRP
jgi:CYTH domain-containing protein